MNIENLNVHVTAPGSVAVVTGGIGIQHNHASRDPDLADVEELILAVRSLRTHAELSAEHMAALDGAVRIIQQSPANRPKTRAALGEFLTIAKQAGEAGKAVAALVKDIYNF